LPARASTASMTSRAFPALPSRGRAATAAALRRRSFEVAQKRRQRADEPLRKPKHDGDEERRHQHFPERYGVAKRRGHRADQQRSEDGSGEASSAPDRRPNNEVCGKVEAGKLRRHQTLLRSIQRAADSGEDAADSERERFERARIEAEERDAAVVLRERAPQNSDRSAREPSTDRKHGDEHRRRRIIVSGEIAEARQTRNSLESVEAARHLLPVARDLERQQRKGQRDHRKVRAELAQTSEHHRPDDVRDATGRERGRRNEREQPRISLRSEKRKSH